MVRGSPRFSAASQRKKAEPMGPMPSATRMGQSPARMSVNPAVPASARYTARERTPAERQNAPTAPVPNAGTLLVSREYAAQTTAAPAARR